MKVPTEIQSFSEIQSMFCIQDSESIYETLIELGKLIQSIDEKYKVDENKVYGCQSNVWIVIDDNNIYADSNSAIVKGFLYILLSIISSIDFSLYKDYESYIFDKIQSIGLMNHISTFRKSGLIASMQKLCSLLKISHENS